MENRRTKPTAVEIGKRNGLSAEVVKGIAEGVFVIANPKDEVKDGVRVKMRK